MDRIEGLIAKKWRKKMSYNLADAIRDQICEMLELDVPVTLSEENQDKLLGLVDQLADMAEKEAERVRLAEKSMSGAKLTNEVWWVDGKYSTFLGVSGDDGVVCDVTCSMDDYHINPTKEELEKANLIAAAPQMYDMLSRIIAELDDTDYTVFCDRGAGKWIRPDICNEADKVLAKARGEL